MKKKYFSKVLLSGQVVTGYVYSMAQLSAKFQLWCRPFGISDTVSLAMWISQHPNWKSGYFSENPHEVAKQGFEAIKGLSIPDLTDTWINKPTNHE